MPRVTITVPERSPQPYRFDLHREIVTVGRGQDNDIVIGCGSVSGKHSEMHRVKGGYHLIDMGSTNGIKIDGIRHQTVVLHTGMTVKLGDVEFGFSLNEEELAILATESESTAKAASSEDDDKEGVDIDDADEKEIPEKPVFKEDDKKEEKKDESEAIADDLDKLPDLAPVRLNKRKEKEEQEAEQRKKAEKEERAKRAEKAEKAEKAAKEERSERREKRKRSEKSEDRDEYSESKAVTIGSGFILFALIAAAAAFFYGASTRHEKDTGEKLLKGIVNKEDAKNDAPTEVDDKADGGAE